MSSEQLSQSQKQQQKQEQPSSSVYNNNNINNCVNNSNNNILEYVSDLKPIRFNGAQTLGIGTLPSFQYGLFSEKIRKTASNGFNCSIFCNGKKCKYEGPANWTSDDMPITGIYSCWVTEDIVTMARPSTSLIQKYKIIKQFKERGIRSLINLQQRGEHANCGAPLEKSGFSYDPQVFMENMSLYPSRGQKGRGPTCPIELLNHMQNNNFVSRALCDLCPVTIILVTGLKDYGSVSKTTLLDMVKVLSFALTEGKVAVHSHCGLGRTAVLIACYLVYSLRCKPNDAVAYLRAKRSDMIKSKNQIQSIQAFAQYVIPMCIVYANVIPRDYRSTLNQYMKRQRSMLHGFEARLLKHVPKPVFMFCEKLLSLLEDHRFLDSSNPDLAMESPSKDFIGDPNRFLGFFSAGYKLDIRFPSKFTSKKEFAMLLEGKHGSQNHVSAKGNHVMMNGLGDPKIRSPLSPIGGQTGSRTDEVSAFPESPASSSSPDGSSTRHIVSNPAMGGQYFKLQEEEEFLDYHLSDDEETGQNPEIEFSNNSHPNSVPLSHCREAQSREASSRSTFFQNGNEHSAAAIISSAFSPPPPPPPMILQNGGIGIIHHKLKLNVDIPTIVDADENANGKPDNNSLEITDVLEEVADTLDEDDPLEELNSEECNDIIDSVLKESSSEEDVLESARQSRYLKRNSLPVPLRDVRTSKHGQECSMVTEEAEEEEEEEEKIIRTPLSNDEISDALLADHYAMEDDFAKNIRKYQRAINYRSSSWDRVVEETDPLVLSALLWSWLDQLREPVLDIRDLSCIVIRAERPLEILQKLDMDTKYTTEYLVRFIAQLRPKTTSLKDDLLKRLLASLTHQTLGIRGTVRPVGKEDWNKMRHGTARELMCFLQRLYDLVLHDQEQISSPVKINSLKL